MPEQDLKEEDLPKQEQPLPGKESEMVPEPEIIRDDYKGSDKLKGRVALITGGDSGIGRSVAVHFVREGAKVAIVYLEEDEDAEKTMEMVKQEGGKCLVIRGDHKGQRVLPAMRGTGDRQFRDAQHPGK